MAARIAFVFLAAFVIFQMLTWESYATVIRRDAPDSPDDASKRIDDALQSFKTGLDDLIKNIQGNELLQNVSASFKSFGEQVQKQGQQLVEKIQSVGKTEATN